MIQNIESFYQTQMKVGLHQVLLFAKAVEPNKRVKYCIATNGQYAIEGFCIIHERFPIAYIQDGPLSDNNDVISQMIQAIEKYYKKKLFAITTIQLPYTDGNIVQYQNTTSINYLQLPTWSTIIINITDVEAFQKIFATGNLATNIRKAIKKGVEVHDTINYADIKSFADLYDATYKHRGLATQWKNTSEYFSSLWQVMQNENGFFIGAYLNEQLVAGGIFLCQGKTVYYKFGASNRDVQNVPLMHSVIYRAMQKASELGYKYFDLGGINPDAVEGDQVFAINTFKKGFGGTVITSPKRIFITNNPVSLAIVLFLLKLKKLVRN